MIGRSFARSGAAAVVSPEAGLAQAQSGCRYAVYFAPRPESSLHRLGIRWLGRDHLTGEEIEQPAVAGITPQRLSQLTAFPRRYGFHGTLKAPFYLADGRSLEELEAAAARFAQDWFGDGGFAAGHLRLRASDRFLSFELDRRCEKLDRLARDCVLAFEPFRAPLSDAEIRRRREAGLSARQDRYLLAYGYPGIFEEFSFHMTLAGPFDRDARGQEELALLFDAVEGSSGSLLFETFVIDGIALYEQPSEATPFTLIGRYGCQPSVIKASA